MNRSTLIKLVVLLLVLMFSAPASATPLNECVDGWLDYWEELFGEDSSVEDVGIAKGKCCKDDPSICESSSGGPVFGIAARGVIRVHDGLVARKLQAIRDKRRIAKGEEPPR